MYVYVDNDPVNYVDTTGHWPDWRDIGLFFSGAAYELSNTMSYGLGGVVTDGIADDMPGAFQYGRDLGAGAGMVVGVVELVVGGIGAFGGGALCATGVGCAIGGPAVAVSAGTAAAGAGHAAKAGIYFSRRWDDYDDYDDAPKKKTGKGGQKSGGHANHQIKDAGKKAGLSELEIREFGDYVEGMKKSSGRGGADNYSYGELVQMAKEWKGGTR